MVDLSRDAIRKLLGAGFCSENNNNEEVCIYANMRSDRRIYLKVTVDGEKVAHAVVKPKEIISLLTVAVLAAQLDGNDIEALWSAVKKVQRREKAQRKRKMQKKREEEEEGEEEAGEEEELELL